MATNDDQHYHGAILEDISDKLSGIAEAVSGVDTRLQRVEHGLEGLKEQVQAVDGRLRVVEQQVEVLPAIAEAVQAVASDADDHERRIRRLERKTA